MSTAWRYAPLLLLTAIIGCGDSKTASLEREQDRLQRRIASLEAENAELRDRANSLSLDLDHQRHLYEELRTKLKSGHAEKQEAAGKPSASSERPQEIAPPTRAAEAPSAENKHPAPTAAETAPPARTAAKPATPEAIATVKPLLPDIAPASAKKKPVAAAPAAPGPPAEAPKPEAKKAETERQPAPAREEAAEARPTVDDPFAPFKRAPGAESRAESKTAPPSSEKKTEEAEESPAPPKAVARPSGGLSSSPPSELQLVDVSRSSVGNAVRISGFVANNTKKPVSRVRVKAVFLDAEGATIASGEYPVAAGGRLGGGERAPFEITSPEDPEIARWRLTVLGEQ